MSELNTQQEEPLSAYRDAAVFFYDLLYNTLSYDYLESRRFFPGTKYSIFVSTRDDYSGLSSRGLVKVSNFNSKTALVIGYVDPDTNLKDLTVEGDDMILSPPDFLQDLVMFNGTDPRVFLLTRGPRTVRLSNGLDVSVSPYSVNYRRPAHPLSYDQQFVINTPEEAIRVLTRVRRDIEETTGYKKSG